MSDFEADDDAIHHEEDLSRDSKSFLYTSERSDVMFNVENVTFKANKFILSLRSEYFRTMFASSFLEAGDTEIAIRDTTAEAFGTMLEYLYSGSVNLLTLTVSDTIQLLHLASLYRLNPLYGAIELFLKNWVKTDQMDKIAGVLLVLSNAIVFSMTELVAICLEFLDQNARSALECEDFNCLSREAFEMIMKGDSFVALSIDIRKTESAWIKHKNEFKRKPMPPSVKLKRWFASIFGLRTELRLVSSAAYCCCESCEAPQSLNGLYEWYRRNDCSNLDLSSTS